jgi:hypothetical protein
MVNKKKINTAGYLLSRIPLGGRLLDLQKLRNIIKMHPALQPLSYGSSCRYLVNEEDMQTRFYIVEFSHSAVSIEIYSVASPLIFIKEGVAHLLAFASFVEAVYDFDIKSIFPYLIEALTSEKLDYYMNVKGIERRGSPETILSARIINLKKETSVLRKQNDENRQKIANVTAIILRTRCRSICSIKTLTQEMGLSEEDIRNATDYLRAMGQRVVWHGKGEFSVVGI